jgi:hypothetical protein
MGHKAIGRASMAVIGRRSHGSARRPQSMLRARLAKLQLLLL